MDNVGKMIETDQHHLENAIKYSVNLNHPWM